jgi:hypothetical protein
MEHTKHWNRAEDLVAVIRGLQSHLEQLSEQFRQDPGGKEPDFDKWSSNDWRRNTFGNALVRLRQLTENNFQVIETMGLLSVARYVFELSIWLQLFRKDARYCLIYYRELLETQRRYYKDTNDHLHREVELLKRFEARDSDATDKVIRAASTEGFAGRVGEMMDSAMDRVDAEAGRNFSLYLEDARTNGYGFQAYLVEKKAIPQIEEALNQITKEIQEFKSRVPQDVQKLAPGRWNWSSMAKEVGLLHEHDYIYSYASKLLHATPASLTTDQKN